MNSYKKALVLLHGHGLDDTIWDNLDAVLNEYYTVIRPNMALFTFCNTVEDYADELHRFLTNATISQCTLIGHSMGGYIGLAFAEKYPEMLQGFGLFHSTAYADDETKKHQRNQTLDLLKNYGAEMFVKNTAANLYSERFIELYPDKLKEHVAKFGALPTEALMAGVTAMRARADRTHVLAKMPCPVLFILGMQDKLLKFESTLNLTSLPRRSYPFILAEAGHMGMIEKPDAVFRIINWYMNTL